MAISLKEAMTLIRDSSPDMAMSNPDLMEFITDIGNAGADAMKQISDDEKIGAVSLIMSCIIADMLAEGNVDDAIMLLARHTVFESIVAVALRTSVGLSVTEEWR